MIQDPSGKYIDWSIEKGFTPIRQYLGHLTADKYIELNTYTYTGWLVHVMQLRSIWQCFKLRIKGEFGGILIGLATLSAIKH